MILLSLSVCVLVLTSIYSWISFWRDTKKTNVQGPFPYPFIGNGHLIAVKPKYVLGILSELCGKFGGAVRMYVLWDRFVILSNKKYIEPILFSTDSTVKGRSYDYMRAWLGNGLLTVEDYSKWKKHRKFLTPAFHFTIVQTFLPTILRNSAIFINKLRDRADGSTLNVFPLIGLAALDIITESIMGTSVNAQKDNKSAYVSAVEKISYVLSRRMQNIFALLFFNVSYLKTMQDSALKVLHGQTNRVIEARCRELEKANITHLDYNADYGMKNKHMFLDLMLLAQNNGERMDEQSIRDEVNTFMFEGHDTTTSAIAFCLYCLSNNKDVQEKLFEEQRTIFGENIKAEPSYSDLNEMRYLEMVIKESLRLYPPVPLIERKLTRDMDIEGYHLPKDTLILINIFETQRNPELYADPLVFRPERFEPSAKTVFSGIPFSAGPRNCIGQKFALMEMKVMISSIVKNFELLPSGIEPEMSPDLILRPNGIYLKLLPRL